MINNEARFKRLYYRSWHRGCKETDLVLGGFAENQLATLDPSFLDAYEQLLEEEDVHIWDWLTGKIKAPDPYAALIAMMVK